MFEAQEQVPLSYALRILNMSVPLRVLRCEFMVVSSSPSDYDYLSFPIVSNASAKRRLLALVWGGHVIANSHKYNFFLR